MAVVILGGLVTTTLARAVRAARRCTCASRPAARGRRRLIADDPDARGRAGRGGDRGTASPGRARRPPPPGGMTHARPTLRTAAIALCSSPAWPRWSCSACPRCERLEVESTEQPAHGRADRRAGRRVQRVTFTEEAARAASTSRPRDGRRRRRERHTVSALRRAHLRRARQDLGLHEPEAARRSCGSRSRRRASRATGVARRTGPAAGTKVVTVGAAELYGAEFDIGK